MSSVQVRAKIGHTCIAIQLISHISYKVGFHSVLREMSVLLREQRDGLKEVA
jgi:hypothetical protein